MVAPYIFYKPPNDLILAEQWKQLVWKMKSKKKNIWEIEVFLACMIFILLLYFALCSYYAIAGSAIYEIPHTDGIESERFQLYTVAQFVFCPWSYQNIITMNGSI